MPIYGALYMKTGFHHSTSRSPVAGQHHANPLPGLRAVFVLTRLDSWHGSSGMYYRAGCLLRWRPGPVLHKNIAFRLKHSSFLIEESAVGANGVHIETERNRQQIVDYPKGSVTSASQPILEFARPIKDNEHVAVIMKPVLPAGKIFACLDYQPEVEFQCGPWLHPERGPMDRNQSPRLDGDGVIHVCRERDAELPLPVCQCFKRVTIFGLKSDSRPRQSSASPGAVQPRCPQ